MTSLVVLFLVLFLLLWHQSESIAQKVQGNYSTHGIATCSRSCSSQQQHSFVKKVRQVLRGHRTIGSNVFENPHNASQKYALFRRGNNDFFFAISLLDADTLRPVWDPPVRSGRMTGKRSPYHYGKGKFVLIMDPRYFTFQNRHYLVFFSGYGINRDADPCRINLMEIVFDADSGTVACLLDTVMTIRHETSISQKINEKNWAPFSFPLNTINKSSLSYNVTSPSPFLTAESQLLVEYSMLPHQVMEITSKNVSTLPGVSKWQAGGKLVESVACTVPHLNNTFWAGETIRNGSPPILLPPHALRPEGGGYLAFFHYKNLMRRYVMGAFVFEADPPFAISHISPEPIVARYGRESASQDKTIYPFMQYLSQGVDSRYVVHVSVHRNVKETWEMEIDLLGLLASLIKVDSHTC